MFYGNEVLLVDGLAGSSVWVGGRSVKQPTHLSFLCPNLIFGLSLHSTLPTWQLSSSSEPNRGDLGCVCACGSVCQRLEFYLDRRGEAGIQRRASGYSSALSTWETSQIACGYILRKFTIFLNNVNRLHLYNIIVIAIPMQFLLTKGKVKESQLTFK